MNQKKRVWVRLRNKASFSWISRVISQEEEVGIHSYSPPLKVIQQAKNHYLAEVSWTLEGDVGGSVLRILFTLPFGHQTTHIPFSMKLKIPNEEIIKTTVIFLELSHVSTALVSGCTVVALTLLLAWKIIRLWKKNIFSCVCSQFQPDSWMSGLFFLLSDVDGISSRVIYWILNKITQKKKSLNFKPTCKQS